MIDKFNFSEGAAWINNKIIPINKASIPITDWGLIHSDIAYDVVPVWEGGFFRVTDYINRFIQSMHALRLNISMNETSIYSILHDIVATSKLKNAYVSMVASRGTPLTPGNRDPRQCANHFYSWCVPYIHVVKPEIATKGTSAWIPQNVRRIPNNSVNPRIKNYHWGDFTSGLFEAKDNGAETVILQDQEGNITEGPGFNVFIIKNNIVFTPEVGILEGITRRTLLEIIEEKSMKSEVRKISIDEFYASDEIFLTSSAGGVIPITKINNQIFSNGVPGPLTQMFYNSYWQFIKRTDLRKEIQY